MRSRALLILDLKRFKKHCVVEIAQVCHCLKLGRVSLIQRRVGAGSGFALQSSIEGLTRSFYFAN